MDAKELYQKDIIDLSRRSRLRLPIENPGYSARVDNPLCGDRVTLDFNLENKLIKDVGLRARGCALCEAAAEVLAVQAVGRNSDDIIDTYEDLKAYLLGTVAIPKWSSLKVFSPVKPIVSRHECVLLPFDAAKKAFSM